MKASGKHKKLLVCGLIVFLVLIVIAEIGARLTGVMDFPIYSYDPVRGYALVPDQSGRFLNKNRWTVNNRGLVNDRDYTAGAPNCFLVGDSIVYGGNPVAMDDRVTALAQNRLGYPVWTLSMGGWNIEHSLLAMQKHMPEIDRSDALVLVLNSGDFVTEGEVRDDVNFPTERPLLALPYLVEKYVISTTSELPDISHLQPIGVDFWGSRLEELARRYPHRISIILYADLIDLQDRAKWRETVNKVSSFAAGYPGKIEVIDLTADSRWTDQMYRDGVHPNADGNRILATAIARQCGAGV